MEGTRSPADLVEALTGVRPRSGRCIFCKKDLTTEDIDHSVCNKCWSDTFACKICGDESGECEHQGEE